MISLVIITAGGKTMEYRKFEKSGVSPSLLGFGCMRFPTLENGEINEQEAKAMIDKAMAHGVTYIDTAYPYHNGDSEPFVGKVLKNYDRQSFYLATKLPIWNISCEEDVEKIFNEQLQRLDVDYVDFYLLHALDKEKWEKVSKYNILEHVEKMQKAGKIKYIGFSFHDEYEVFENIVKSYSWDFCQLQINYMDMDIQAGMKGIQLCDQLNLPVVVMEPIKGGSLATLPQKVADIFKQYDKHRSLSSWALRYVGSLPAVKVILSGMSTMEQVEDNLATFDQFQKLNEEEMALVEKVTKTLKAKTKNGCTGCKYCMPCPFGVNIPNNFKYWNCMSIYEDEKTFKEKYIRLQNEQASQCRQCGKCETMCPQHIAIREDLKRVVQDMES